jgi:hypothetical protein
MIAFGVVVRHRTGSVFARREPFPVQLFSLQIFPDGFLLMIFFSVWLQTLQLRRSVILSPNSK